MSQQTTPLLALLAAAILSASTLHAQAYTPPPPPLTTAPCVPTRKDPCTAPNTTPPPAKVDKFAFPGDTPDTPDAPPPTSDPTAKPAPKPTSSDPFPFPTDDSKPAPSSSSSSSSSSATPPDDPAAPPLKDEGSSGNTRAERRRKLAKVEDPDTREAKDIEVARFYLSTGNFAGAYARAKDAIRLYPDDAEAHFALAAAAQKLKKNDEALAEYNSYLKLDPDGDHVKVAQRALTEIH